MKTRSFIVFVAPHFASVRAFVPVSFDYKQARDGRSRRIFYVNDENHQDVQESSSDEDDIVPATSSARSSPTSLQHRPPILALLETEDNWKEWHYSFSRNGLTDFLPQFSAHISCCLIGGGDDNSGNAGRSIAGTSQLGTQLPWQVDSDASCSITHGGVADQSATATTSDAHLLHKSNTVLGNLATATTSMVESGEEGFDCILDGGVMNAVVSSLPDTVTWHSRAGPQALLELHNLMQEANAAIREFGIYVAITEGPVPNHAKEYLVAMGEVMGMQWKFELDGLSNEDYSVSVARKYFSGVVNVEDGNGVGDNMDIDGQRLLP